ncbi:MAG: biotin/lipoate A/B protein ligase family protein [Candidatus Aureabacteria bacterium]|nr:biotin/lipoate A/B protein ligase family protein [Candidatus Auribacterota bacterium]
MSQRFSFSGSSRDWRLILSGCNDAFTNMALDETLLDSYCDRGAPPTLRIYGWHPPAFSIGYFQDPRVNLDLDQCERHKIAVVRRMTGGAVLFHFHDISYSIVCTLSDLRINYPIKYSYEILSSFLINLYRYLGLEPSFALQADPALRHTLRMLNSKPEFCQATTEMHDIVIGNKKIGGNAQRRRNNVILQHGSIPLRNMIESAGFALKENISRIKNNMTSLDELLGSPVDFHMAERLLKESFERTFYVDLKESPLSESESAAYEKLKSSKYLTPEWNMERASDSPTRPVRNKNYAR